MSPRNDICTRCVMDRSDPDIVFDDRGVCTYCRQYDDLMRTGLGDPVVLRRRREETIEMVRRAGRGRRYDCVIGLSGGVDSSYAAYEAKKAGLRPLAVHVDNGWDSELAVMNIENIVRKLNLDLETIVIDWREFRDLQLSMLRASVVDVELPSDHAIIAGVYRMARRHGVKYILSGNNVWTEATLPATWNHRKTDLRNLLAIHRHGGGGSLTTFPKLSTVGMLLHEYVLGIHNVPFLTYFPYKKEEAIATMQRELGWRPYGGKHYESIITRFYQGYILVRKFGIDKRRIHFSRLICSGQMTRDEALAALRESPYDPALLESDRAFVLKKLRLGEEEFERLMNERPRSHLSFPNEERYLRALFATKRGLVAARRLAARSVGFGRESSARSAPRAS